MIGGGLSLLTTPRYGSAVLAPQWSPLTHHGLVAKTASLVTPGTHRRFWEDYEQVTTDRLRVSPGGDCARLVPAVTKLLGVHPPRSGANVNSSRRGTGRFVAPISRRLLARRLLARRLLAQRKAEASVESSLLARRASLSLVSRPRLRRAEQAEEAARRRPVPVPSSHEVRSASTLASISKTAACAVPLALPARSAAKASAASSAAAAPPNAKSRRAPIQGPRRRFGASTSTSTQLIVVAAVSSAARGTYAPPESAAARASAARPYAATCARTRCSIRPTAACAATPAWLARTRR